MKRCEPRASTCGGLRFIVQGVECSRGDRRRGRVDRAGGSGEGGVGFGIAEISKKESGPGRSHSNQLSGTRSLSSPKDRYCSGVNEFIGRFENIIASHGLLRKGDCLLVAVSGGIDSMVLLHCLHWLSATHRWKLAVAHFNHQLRGVESNADERFVRRAARKLGLPFHCARSEVRPAARTSGISVEMAARALRHAFLARTARGCGSRKIALAHHADDQVELFFLRLLRGAGSQGLGGMGWSSPSPVSPGLVLLRPLLGETKAALADFARTEKIAFREDSTNRSNDIQRNLVRNELLPLLRHHYQPQIDRAVLRSMRLIHDEGEFVTQEAIQWLKSLRPLKGFDELPTALQRRVVQIELLASGVIPQFEQVEQLRTRAGEWVSVRDGGHCRRSPAGRIETRSKPVPPTLPAARTLGLGVKPGEVFFGSLAVRWRIVSGHRLPKRRALQSEQLDADAIGDTVVLRHWRNGDRFQPIGLPHSAKLQDLFVNLKIPRVRRHQLVLATTATGEIIWVEGLRIGERFKVIPATRRKLIWKWSDAVVATGC